MSQSFTVRAPLGTATGTHAGVEFSDGAAVVDAAEHPSALRYFRKAGYEVVPVAAVADPTPAPAPPPVADDPVPVRRPNKAATKAAWVAYALASGGDPAEVEAATRAALIDRYGS